MYSSVEYGKCLNQCKFTSYFTVGTKIAFITLALIQRKTKYHNWTIKNVNPHAESVNSYAE